MESINIDNCKNLIKKIRNTEKLNYGDLIHLFDEEYEEEFKCNIEIQKEILLISMFKYFLINDPIKYIPIFESMPVFRKINSQGYSLFTAISFGFLEILLNFDLKYYFKLIEKIYNDEIKLEHKLSPNLKDKEMMIASGFTSKKMLLFYLVEIFENVLKNHTPLNINQELINAYSTPYFDFSTAILMLNLINSSNIKYKCIIGKEPDNEVLEKLCKELQIKIILYSCLEEEIVVRKFGNNQVCENKTICLFFKDEKYFLGYFKENAKILYKSNLQKSYIFMKKWLSYHKSKKNCMNCNKNEDLILFSSNNSCVHNFCSNCLDVFKNICQICEDNNSNNNNVKYC